MTYNSDVIQGIDFPANIENMLGHLSGSSMLNGYSDIITIII